MEQIANPAIAVIEILARRQGLSLSSLAERSNVSPGTLTNMAKNPVGSPSVATLRKIAPTLGKTYTELAAAIEAGAIQAGSDAPPDFSAIERAPTLRRSRGEFRQMTIRKDLPVRGTASGSLTSGFILGATVDYVYRPPALEDVSDAYAIYVVNSSMAPMHLHGDLCFVNPHAPVVEGDSAIINVRMYPNAAPEAFIKTFKGENDTDVVAAQINPKAEIRYKKNSIVSVDRVLRTRELFAG